MKKKGSLWEKINNVELMGGVIAFVIFGVIKVLSAQLPSKVSAYPIAMSNLGFALAVLLLLRCFYRLKKGTIKREKMFCPDKEKYVGFIICLALLVGYTIAFRYLGFLIATPSFAFLFVFMFGENKSLRAAVLTAVGITLVIYIVFKVLLGIPLPALKL